MTDPATSSSSRFETFQSIYHQNLWGGRDSWSGTGSDISATSRLTELIPWILRILEAKTLLDAPCGDFLWMAKVVRQVRKKVPGFRYTGIDIVQDALQRATQFARDSGVEDVCTWQQLDLVHSIPPVQADLILIRDLLGHLPLNDVHLLLQNVSRSGSTWLLTTHFPSVTNHREIQMGHWQPINLCAPPFHWPAPAYVFREGSPEVKEKSLALWRLPDRN